MSICQNPSTMSNPEEADTCVLDTQETYYEGANESSKVISETQNMSLNESQDFRLVDSEGDESMVERIKQTQDEKANPQKLVQQMDSQQIPEALQSKMDNNAITTNDKEDKVMVDKKVIENEAIKKTEENVSGELCESEKKDKLFDEDEVIQGTPPQSYSPSRKIYSIDVTSLKRKARAVDEPPAKVPRTISAEDTTNVKNQFEEEESRQSCESDDSYQDMFKNINRNVIIEETQDPTNLEFTQNTLRIPAERATETADDDKAQERHSEQVNQQQDEVFSEKCCNVEKDENLNVSAKLTDTSANDSTVVNINSTNESVSQLEDNNLSVETKEDVTSTSVIIADEKSGIGTLDETDKSVKNTEIVSDENNQVEQSNCVEPAEKTIDNNDEEIPSSQTKSRTSIELIFEGANRTVSDGESRSKPQVIQIDDDDEKIVLDSSAEVIYDHQSAKTKPEVVQIDDSHEDGEKIVLDLLGKSSEGQTVDKSSCESKSSTDFSYRSMESVKESSLDSKLTTDKRLVNGSTESKRSDTDATLSLDSDTFSASDEQILSAAVITAAHDMKKIDSAKGNFFTSKDMDKDIELISISDHEMSNVEEKNKSDLIHNNMLVKTVQVEREIGMYLKLKCLMHVDESTKEPVSKELTAVQCEPVIIESRQKNEDSQSSLADISDNKDSSPGSVNSNIQLYQLNPSRLSIMSSISSSSSVSSAASLATKLAMKSVHFFPMPLGPAKHTKKPSQDILPIMPDKQTLDETYDHLMREWKNHRLLTTTILNHANAELSSITTTAATAVTIIDTFTNERLDDHLEKNMRSSTPSDPPATDLKIELTVTPKSTKKDKAVKRPRNKLARSNAAQTNGENGVDNNLNNPIHTSATETDLPSRKKSKMESTEDKLLISDVDILANSSPRNVLDDELIGKNVFAKWSDNNYYPGTVSDQLKAKYKVSFYDGKSKTLIPEFVIPIPKILRKGLSVYATTKTNDYGSCGIIVDVHMLANNETYYTVETDEGERLRVRLQEISLSTDQAQVLKEEVDSTGKSSLPNTPKALGQVTLDNMIDGKRRSKRLGTPLFSTPKSRSNAAGTSTSASKTKSVPSVSGMSAKLKKKKSTLSENDGISSDSNVESTQMQDEYVLTGVQKEIIGTPYEQIVKGPQSRIKSKPRSKKKVEDPQTIATLGPIPSTNTIFKGMSFILTCVPLETLDRYLDTKIPAASSTETEATETDAETENEDDWVDRPFVRDRLHTQILAGGGKIYEDFQQIPKDEYNNTKLITNVPNTTAKSILCLSAGIPVCNHKWIIRCCAEGKIVSAAEHALPTGWSLLKKAYVETFETGRNKPLSEVVVIIPSLASNRQFATFWRQVCENAGAVVLIAEDSETMEMMDFDSNVVVVSNQRCPSWAIDRAIRQKIPVLSTMWVIQCIIEGKLCPQDQHLRYKYNYISN